MVITTLRLNLIRIDTEPLLIGRKVTDANAFVYDPNPLEIQTSSYPSTCSLWITRDYFPLPENVQLPSHFVLRVYLCLEHFPSLSSIWDPTHLWRWIQSPSFIHWIRMDCSISCTPAAYQILICIVTYLSVTSTSGIKWECRHWGVLPAQQVTKSTKLNPVSWIDEKYNFNFFSWLADKIAVGDDILSSFS